MSYVILGVTGRGQTLLTDAAGKPLKIIQMRNRSKIFG